MMTTTQRHELAAKRAKMRFRICEVMQERGYTMSKLGLELGVSCAAISKVVNGQGHSERVLDKLREIGVPEVYLFDPRTVKTKGKVA